MSSLGLADRAFYLVVSALSLACSQGEVKLNDETLDRYTKQDSVCRELGARYSDRIEELGLGDYTNLDVADFYSPTIDACIHTEVKIVGFSYSITEVSGTFFSSRVWAEGVSILDCGRYGANSVILDSVRAYDGRVDNLRYDKWLDDGFGGPPATMETTAQPWTKKQCQGLFDGWVSRLRP